MLNDAMMCHVSGYPTRCHEILLDAKQTTNNSGCLGFSKTLLAFSWLCCWYYNYVYNLNSVYIRSWIIHLNWSRNIFSSEMTHIKYYVILPYKSSLAYCYSGIQILFRRWDHSLELPPRLWSFFMSHWQYFDSLKDS